MGEEEKEEGATRDLLLSRSQKKRETEGRGVCVCTFIFLSVASSLPPI